MSKGPVAARLNNAILIRHTGRLAEWADRMHAYFSSHSTNTTNLVQASQAARINEQTSRGSWRVWIMLY